METAEVRASGGLGHRIPTPWNASCRTEFPMRPGRIRQSVPPGCCLRGLYLRGALAETLAMTATLEIKKTVCPGCLAVLDVGDRFCRHCGTATAPGRRPDRRHDRFWRCPRPSDPARTSTPAACTCQCQTSAAPTFRPIPLERKPLVRAAGRVPGSRPDRDPDAVAKPPNHAALEEPVHGRRAGPDGVCGRHDLAHDPGFAGTAGRVAADSGAVSGCVVSVCDEEGDWRKRDES